MNFLGIKQVLFSTYSGLSKEEKIGYLWLVSNETTTGTPNGSYDIYFGSRKYSENGIVYANLLKAFEGLLDVDGAFVLPITKEFTSFNEESVESISDILYALDAAVKANQTALTAVYTKGEVDNLISGIEGTIAAYVKDVKVKLNAEGEAESLEHDENGAVIIDLSSFATKTELDNIKVPVTDVTVDGTSVVKDGVAEIVIPEVKVPEYSIVKQESAEENSAATYYLTKDGEQVGVKINIPLDQVLESATIETVETEGTPYEGAKVGDKYIKFIFQNNENPQYLPVQDLVDVYTAGAAIAVSDNNEISVKVASEGNFLSINDNNELVVDDINANKTLISEAITIAGGPLEAIAKKAYPDGVVPAGTDVQAFFKALLCVEIYPNPTANTPTYSISIAAPSVTADVSNGALVEVGQTIAFNAVTANGVSVNPTHPKVQKFDNGYSTGIDTEINTATSVTASWTTSQKEGETYGLSATSTGFTGTLPTSVSNAAAASCTLSAVSLVAVEGTNSYKVTETAPKYTGSHSGISSYYIVSNLKGRKEEKKSPAIAAASGVEKTASSQSSTFTVTGVYPIFTNGISAGVDKDNKPTGNKIDAEITGDGTKLALMTGGTTFCVSFPAHAIAASTLFLPGTWKVTSAYCTNPLTGKYETDCKSKFVADGTTTRTIQGKEVTYNVYKWQESQGADFIKFTVA